MVRRWLAEVADSPTLIRERQVTTAVSVLEPRVNDDSAAALAPFAGDRARPECQHKGRLHTAGRVRPATASANRNNDSNHHETIIESPGCSTNAGAPLHSSSAQCAGASTLGLPRGRRGQGLGLISQAAGAAPARPRRGPASLTSSAPQAL